MDPLIGSHLGELWEYGALVTLLVLTCIILCYVCRVLYNRNIKLGDDMLKALQESTKVITELREELRDARRN